MHAAVELGFLGLRKLSWAGGCCYLIQSVHGSKSPSHLKTKVRARWKISAGLSAPIQEMRGVKSNDAMTFPAPTFHEFKTYEHYLDSPSMCIQRGGERQREWGFLSEALLHEASAMSGSTDSICPKQFPFPLPCGCWSSCLCFWLRLLLKTAGLNGVTYAKPQVIKPRQLQFKSPRNRILIQSIRSCLINT